MTRREYCTQPPGPCAECSLTSYNRDCMNLPIDRDLTPADALAMYEAGEIERADLHEMFPGCFEDPDAERPPLAVYVITADAHDLEGWTPESLADALRAPLAELGIDVKANPKQFGDCGLKFLDDLPDMEADTIRGHVKRLVERVIEDGPEGERG